MYVPFFLRLPFFASFLFGCCDFFQVYFSPTFSFVVWDCNLALSLARGGSSEEGEEKLFPLSGPILCVYRLKGLSPHVVFRKEKLFKKNERKAHIGKSTTGGKSPGLTGANTFISLFL